MQVELTPRECAELLSVLDMHLGELQREVWRTDHREFRQTLRAKYDTLDAIRRRLQLREDEQQVYA